MTGPATTTNQASPKASSSQVRVGVRIRPLTHQETSQGGKRVVDALASNVGIGQRKFTYDSVFDSHVSQTDLYGDVSPNLLNSFLDGYNATIMAYGQTGSGKTFTMGSEAHSSSGTMGMGGLIPRFMADMFDRLSQKKKNTNDNDGDTKTNNNKHKNSLVDYRMSASFLEVYGEDIHDLLDKDRRTLPLREDSNGGVIVVGLKIQPVAAAPDALKVLHVGTLNRTTAATLMNLTSSRSHAVFTIHLEQIFRSTTGGDGNVDMTTTSQFTFVDLAGSERMKKTGAEGARAREGIKINEGLLALGNVINALADDERLAKEKKVYVPYRQSKLTRLLQDALGGNSQTLFLACISPSDTNASETLSTLHYANRARNIKNAPTKNVDGAVVELQRLNTLNYILQCELVKQRFDDMNDADDGTEQVGEASESLWQRKDVQEYIQLIYKIADEKRGDSSCNTSHPAAAMIPGMADTTLTSNNSSSSNSQIISMPMESTENNEHNFVNTTMSKFDDSLLDDVNPDEEMAMLDQLLELQHTDNVFDKEQKKDQEKLEQVEGELQEQETMLLQLRESLKVYHSMKTKYETLMTEVQNLETEKISLANELEKASEDPSKGCSMAIKKKLQTVERSLARTRTETKKHQQMYRKAEQEAQKCKALERKISDLKQGKVALVKRQREAALKHKEYTETKKREIAALKRKEKKSGQRVTKLESEIQIHKQNLGKRQVYCNKLSEKLKQTESHLMKLLTMRKKELHDRSSIASKSSRTATTRRKPRNFQKEESFAPKTEEILSLQFMLQQMVSERVDHRNVKLQYEQKFADYSELMRHMVAEVKELKKARSSQCDPDHNGRDTNNTDVHDTVREHEQNVEDLELKLELASGDLDMLRSKLGNAENESNNPGPGEEMNDGELCTSESEEAALKVIVSLGAPVTRTLLWEMTDQLAISEFDRRRQKKSIQRKDSALQSFESEVEGLTKTIDALSKDLTQRRKISLSTNDPVEKIQRLENKAFVLNEDFQNARQEREKFQMELKTLQGWFAKIDRENAVTKEKLTIAEAVVKQSAEHRNAEPVLERLQDTWEELGVTTIDRESVRLQIESCLEDTCTRKLKEATALKTTTLVEIATLRQRIASMYSALGMQPEIVGEPSIEMHASLLGQLETLKQQEGRLRPTFDSAVERRSNIVKDVHCLMDTMGLFGDQLTPNLSTLIRQNEGKTKAKVTLTPMKRLRNSPMNTSKDLNEGNDATFFGRQKSLDESFLETCEQDVKGLRVLKSETLVKNAELREVTKEIIAEMHLSANEVPSLALQSTKRRSTHTPSWWDAAMADEVCRIIVTKDGVVGATVAFSKHLELIHDSLESITNGRRSLSTELQTVVKRAHETLLTTVDGEIDASEAYTSFHDALFRIPTLSKEHIHACIVELNALVVGVDAMTQSEIEALTVVWEALNISSSERGQFWCDMEESTSALQKKSGSPFDMVLESCTADIEEWLLSAVKDARKVYLELNVRLQKLEQIHQKVEKLRSKQDAKSKIISLDSEIRILNTKLADFENKTCSKQRLVSKKKNSSVLLKEERFRKQMQGKFASRLEQLGKLLGNWTLEEKKSFDANLLSEEVRMLLENSDHLHTRTAFMHLRTVKAKPTTTPAGKKRRAPDNIDYLQQVRGIGGESPMRQQPVKSAKKARHMGESPTPNVRNLPRNETISSSAKRQSTTRKRLPDTNAKEKNVLSPHRPQVGPRGITDKSTPNRRETLLPFGHLFAESSSPVDKENDYP